LRAVALLNDVRNAPGDKKIQAAVDALANTAGDMNLLPSWVQQIGNIVTTTGAQKAQEAGYALGSQVPDHWALRDQATAERSTQPDVSGKSSLPAKADDLQKFLASAGTLLKTKFPGTPEQSVPAQLTRSGMEQPNQNPGAEAYVNPLSAREDIPDPVSQEYQRVGVPLSTVPSKVTTSKGYEADLSGEQQRELTQLRGNYLADAIPKGGFQDAEEAQKAATRAEQDAVKDLVDRYPALDQSAVNKKDQKETQAKARVSNAPQSSAWSQALGQQAKSASSPAARPVTPSAKPTSDAWAKALGK